MLFGAIMSSLKSYIPTLARLVEMTPAALYERQRALVRSGLLATSEGKGPGSGVRASPESVGLLLISILASDALADSAERAEAIANCKCLETERCRISGAQKFGDALTWALSSTDNASKVRTITVRHQSPSAHVMYYVKKRKNFDDVLTQFGEQEFPYPISVEAFFQAQDVLIKIAADLAAFASIDSGERK